MLYWSSGGDPVGFGVEQKPDADKRGTWTKLCPRADVVSARGAPMVRLGLSVPTLDRRPATFRGRVPEIGNCRGNCRSNLNLCLAPDEIQFAERALTQKPSAIPPSGALAGTDANRC